MQILNTVIGAVNNCTDKILHYSNTLFCMQDQPKLELTTKIRRHVSFKTSKYMHNVTRKKPNNNNNEDFSQIVSFKTVNINII